MSLLLQSPSGRRKPYTELGIRRMKCAHPGCLERSVFQWSACALGGRYMAICLEHDLAVNRWLLETFCVPGHVELLRDYERQIRAEGE